MVEARAGIAVGLLSGRLEGIAVPDLVWTLCAREATGVLTLARDGVRRSLYLSDGRIVFAGSSDPDDRLGELLLRSGWVRLEQLQAGLEKLGTGKRLGTILVEAGHLSTDDLVRGVLAQVRGIVLDAFTWEDGEYSFEAGPLPTDETITLAMPTGDLLLQGIRRVRSFSRIRARVGSPATVYRRVPGSDELRSRLQLTPGERQLLDRIDHGHESVDNLCREVFLSNFEIYQALWGLRVLGLVEVEDRPARLESEGDAHGGSIGPRGLAEDLLRLSRAAETGVLVATHGTVERTMHLKEGACVFATSNHHDDGLVPYLLRRGVISLRDREETARRLLSNKRVGTILRELGVIDDLDLRTLVREHLSEIVEDTLQWHRGDWRFRSGELPTIEEITLEVPVEEMVSRALRRVNSWSRVRDGIAGLDRPLRLHPRFLAVLDRTSVGPEEWEIVTALKEPRTPFELCRASKLGDFRVCQIVWTLRTLGVIEPAPEFPATAADRPTDDVVVPYCDCDDDRPTTSEAEGDPQMAAQEQGPATTEESANPEAVFELDEPEDLPFTGESVMAVPETLAEASFEVDTEPPGTPSVEVAPEAPVEAAPAQGAPETPSEASLEVDHDSAMAPLAPVEQAQLVSDIEALATAPAEDLSATRRMSAEEIDAALTEPVQDEPWMDGEVPDVSALQVRQEAAQREATPWNPPHDLDQRIERFNARQRILFRSIRAELGAAAVRFVRSCCGRAADGHLDPFSQAELRADGTWDAAALREAAVQNRIDRPETDYDRLLQVELDTLRDQIGEARAVALREQIERLNDQRVSQD